jgi:hypothetical protein
MNRPAVAFAAIVCSLALVPGASAQVPAAASKAAPKKDAVPATAAPTPPSPELVKARMKPPVKGTAYVEIIKGQSKRVGEEIVTVTKVKNVSNAPIVGFRIDEYWYAGQKEVSLGTFRLRQALAPGEIIDATTSAPLKPGLTGSQLQFSQANGPVKPTAVKKFTDDKKWP